MLRTVLSRAALTKAPAAACFPAEALAWCRDRERVEGSEQEQLSGLEEGGKVEVMQPSVGAVMAGGVLAGAGATLWPGGLVAKSVQKELGLAWHGTCLPVGCDARVTITVP